MYSHYVNNIYQQPTVTLKPNFYAQTAPQIPSTTAIETNEGLFVIPYYNLGIAMNERKYFQLLLEASHIKVLGLGYKIRKSTMLTENIASRASTAFLENTFENSPCLMIYEDTGHLFDESVGYKGGATATVAAVRGFDGTHNLDTFTFNLNNLPATTERCGAVWPDTQAAGSLLNVSMFTGADPNTTAVQIGNGIPLSMEDEIPSSLMTENEKKSYMWVNPNPQWHSNTNHISGWANRDPRHYWPTTRDEALRQAYRGSLYPLNTDNAIRGGPKAVAADMATDLTAPDVTCEQGAYSDRPPIHYLKVQPLLGPNGPMTIVVNVWIEYMIDLEIKCEGLLNPYGMRFPTANIGGFVHSTNQAEARKFNIWDVRQTTGGSEHFLTIPAYGADGDGGGGGFDGGSFGARRVRTGQDGSMSHSMSFQGGSSNGSGLSSANKRHRTDERPDPYPGRQGPPTTSDPDADRLGPPPPQAEAQPTSEAQA